MKIVRYLLLAFILVTLLVPALNSWGTSPCTRTGTQNSDTIQGTNSRDVLCLKGGGDYGNGHDAADIVRGGQGGDTVVGGNGPDDLIGGPGDDEIFATDQSATDFINGYDGRDRCYGDRGDTFINCERVVRV